MLGFIGAEMLGWSWDAGLFDYLDELSGKKKKEGKRRRMLMGMRRKARMELNWEVRRWQARGLRRTPSC
jgi:hypothetical protein